MVILENKQYKDFNYFSPNTQRCEYLRNQWIIGKSRNIYILFFEDSQLDIGQNLQWCLRQ